MRLGGGCHSLFMPGAQLAQKVTLVTLSTHWPALILIVLLLFIHGPVGGVGGAERRSLELQANETKDV